VVGVRAVLAEELVGILGLSEVFGIQHEDLRRFPGAGGLFNEPSGRCSAGTVSIETDRHQLESESGESSNVSGEALVPPKATTFGTSRGAVRLARSRWKPIAPLGHACPTEENQQPAGPQIMAAERESVCLARGKLQRRNGMYPTPNAAEQPEATILLPTVLGLGTGRPLWHNVRLVSAAKGTG
jgi:hypothetical protein